MALERGIHGLLAAQPETLGEDPLDQIIKNIKRAKVIHLPTPEDAEALRDPDTLAVAELVARFVHPVNRRISTFTSREPISIPPAWNHPDQDRTYSEARLGTKVMQRLGEYQRGGESRRGGITWATVFVAPGNPTRREIFRTPNLTMSELKLTEFGPDNLPVSVLLPTEGSKLDVVGVSQMPQLIFAGGIARGLLEARIFSPRQAKPALLRSA